MESNVICKDFQIGQRNYVCLVEDNAQACGSSLINKKVVIFGDASDFSFYPTKNFVHHSWGWASYSKSIELINIVKAISRYEKLKMIVIGTLKVARTLVLIQFMLLFYILIWNIEMFPGKQEFISQKNTTTILNSACQD